MTRSQVRRFACLLAVALLVVTPLAALQSNEPTDGDFDPEPVVALLELVIDADPDSAGRCLRILSEKVQSGEVAGRQRDSLKQRLSEQLKSLVKDKESPLYCDAVLLGTSLGDSRDAKSAQDILVSADYPNDRRLQALAALIKCGDSADMDLMKTVASVMQQPDKTPLELQSGILAALGRMEKPEVASIVLACYGELKPEVQPKAVELLTQRPSWSRELVASISRKEIPTTALNTNQVRQMLTGSDEELKKLVRSQWGTVRTERNPQREQVIEKMRLVFHENSGDPHRGLVVFRKVCGQCHKIYGEGQEVGPDITGNGRGSFEQLLSNVFDPSLVIGASYQARTVITGDGRVLTGLLAEDSEQRIVLKMQGGKLETIPRDNVDELQVSKLSMMPEGLETQLKPQELVDLFSFLCLDKPPQDSKARLIPGSPTPKPSSD